MDISYQDLNDEAIDYIEKCFSNFNTFIIVNPGNVIMPRKYNEIGQSIIDFKIRSDDVWLLSYPRTGTVFILLMNFLCILLLLFIIFFRFNLGTGNDLVINE